MTPYLEFRHCFSHLHLITKLRTFLHHISAIDDDDGVMGVHGVELLLTIGHAGLISNVKRALKLSHPLATRRRPLFA